MILVIIAVFVRENGKRILMNKKLLGNILRDCKKDLINHPEYKNFAHWTFLIRDNQIISEGKNHRGEPSKKYGYHNHIDKDYRPKFHSELYAIRKCKRGLEDITLVNVRLNRLGEVKMAMPCKVCQNILRNLDIKKIYFTTEDGWSLIDNFV